MAQRTLRATLLVLAAGLGLFLAAPAFANHTVLVEGNCLGTTAQGGVRTAVPPGSCGDYDGDGRVGSAEDTDEADRVFGTLTEALGPGTGAAAGTGANQNGNVLIVASGTYAETVNITAANGNVILQAAPGVEANIDAVLQGSPANTRQSAPGVIVNAPDNRRVLIRNVMSRNWTSGYQILGSSHVTLDGVRAEGNVNYGIEIADNARVAISNSGIHSSGYRVSAAGSFPSAASQPNPGKGIEFDGSSTGTVFMTTVTGSFSTGIDNESTRSVCASHVNVFDNKPNLEKVRVRPECADQGSGNQFGDSVVPVAPGSGPPYGWLLFGLGVAGLGLAIIGGRRVGRGRLLPEAARN